ncbi:MAG: RNA polymerase sigma factor [Pirellulales bacterium]|nr:RNA polymerase sigma factor [Pirellulales bacterium]
MTTVSQQVSHEERFDRWGREHRPAVRGYLLAMVRRPEVADDLTQEVFCRAWEARARYREEGTARAYLLRIADRLAVDRHRRAGHEVTMAIQQWQGHEPVSRADDPSAAASRTEDARLLDAALERLTSLQRRVLLLRYFGQLTFAQIAETVGCPLGTALSHAHRGLAALRGILVEGDR